MIRNRLVGPALRTLASLANRIVPASPIPCTEAVTLRSALRIAPHAMAAFAMALVAAVTSQGAAAQAPVGLARVGPIDPVTGYPLFYEDTRGLKLGLCTDPTSCFFALPDPSQPQSFPGNFPDESFYFAANAGLEGGTNRGLLVIALEAAFAQGAVAVGDNAVFARIRVRFTGLVDGATYTITHPYGVETLVAGIDGPLPGTINMTRDIGLAALEFTGALRGDVGPFLTPIGFVNGGPGTFISDGATETLVQGSPRGTNFFRIQGANAGGVYPVNALAPDIAQVNTFVIQGQVTRIIGAGIQKAFYSRTPTQTSVNVWANSANGVSMAATADGSAATPMVEVGTTGVYFARIELGAGAPRPSVLSVTNLSDLPPTSVSTTSIPDLVKIVDAVFTTGGDLVVQAVSSDKLAPLALTVDGDGLTSATITGPAGSATGAVGLRLGAAPPPALHVSTAVGGVAIDVVDIAGIGTPIGGGGGPVPVVANAGPDISVPAGTIVPLNGTSSTGPVDSFAWSHNAGALISLLGANTPTPVFTAPSVVAALDITFTLTVTDAIGGSSSDTVVVHVTPIPPQPTEALVIDDARWNLRGFWRASGTTTRLTPHVITVYLLPVGNTGRPIGTATSDGTGVWTFTNPRGSASGSAIPLGTDTQVWARSSLGADSAPFVFRRQ